MASESSAGFHHQLHGILVNSGAGATSSSGSAGGKLIPMGNYHYRNGGGSLNLSGNDGPRGGMLFSPHNSLGSSLTHVLDSVSGLKHNTGLAVDWSVEEQYKLEEGLAKFANEPNIVRYIKIAASLRDKTVRDVSLRCRWMMRKRRKHEHPSLGKKVTYQMENLAESALKINMSSASLVNMAPNSLTKNQRDQIDCKFSGVLNGAAGHLLEENNQAFEQISVNLSTLKLQQNIDLFFRTRNNIITILTGMRNLRQMPPLPVFLNEELASSIFPTQPIVFGSSSTKPVKQEPGC